MKNQDELRNEKIGRLLLKYSAPAISSMMVTSLYNTVDRAFIGSIKDIGALAISGLGVTMPLFTILGAFCVAIAIGGSTNISIKLGEENREEAEKILGNTFILSIVVALIIMIGGFFFLEEILYFFGASNDTIIYAKDYISLIIVGSWFNFPGFALNNAIRAEGNPRLAAKMMIISCVLNLILDPIFIFLFNMGIKGAALGTIICQLIVFLWAVYYFTLGKSNLKLKVKDTILNKKILKLIILIALTPFFMELASGFIHLITNRVLKNYGGDLAIGAMTSITSIYLVFLMPVFGLSQGMQTIVAYNYGAKEYNRAKKTLFMTIILATIILTIGFILIRIFPMTFINIFTKDNKLINIAINGLKIYSFTLPTLGISILGAVYFQSIGNVKKSVILSLLRQVIIFIPTILILPRVYGLNGVWVSQPVADIGATIIIGVFLIKEFYIRDTDDLICRVQRT
ncbi:MATE family efflux transporter [Clostridium sp. LIBA-8841]|uniref:MATE family efflux transporter n=1 Tax=Clostridium sp. LIBA-8841 TaxID=2987530 RepID=UPI002AC6A00C|nr:MATE family efflux transporter [Clostridium sp. LIBA-8841]MDZ5252157.1 MATE family efflux transporter [Clostridium sp. LIBA-8841]